MSEYNKSIVIETSTNKLKYEIVFKVNGLNHLCVAKELYDLGLYKYEYSTRFDDWNQFEPDAPFTDEEYLIFLDLFEQIVRSESITHKALLYSMSTGDVTRWSYVRVQSYLIRPFINLLPITDSLTIHSTERENAISTDPDEEDDNIYSGTETVTMFNINPTALLDSYKRPESIAYVFKPQPSTSVTIPTLESIQEFLRSL